MCKLALTRMSTTEDVQAGSNMNVHKGGRASWLLHGCPQRMTCKLALTRMSTTEACKLSLTCMSTTEDVQAGSNMNVHNGGRASWL
ncbi:hypothetical protein DPMN_001008 [Dreissena polymorpha]|uniref:Uncharacterized protein n=1 Tax=Dreissena polymorpha TaxID=45954 RepID=A0A9D4MKW5_DREPO|nr:hypothetical protein DPMN_001006 [Dreissena polymorpha]KAH3877152.1 hypothetical protein DPMN_001008 [Dreissena polymorpha]